MQALIASRGIRLPVPSTVFAEIAGVCETWRLTLAFSIHFVKSVTVKFREGIALGSGSLKLKCYNFAFLL